MTLLLGFSLLVGVIAVLGLAIGLAVAPRLSAWDARRASEPPRPDDGLSAGEQNGRYDGGRPGEPGDGDGGGNGG